MIPRTVMTVMMTYPLIDREESKYVLSLYIMTQCLFDARRLNAPSREANSINDLPSDDLVTQEPGQY